MAGSGTHIPEVLKPRLRVFMSVDVVGSTALKQPEVLEHLIDWLRILQSFYGETVLAVQHEWERLQRSVPKNDHEKFLGEAPQFWKTVGDEVLFYKELTDSRQLALTIECWKRALNTVRAFFDKQNHDILAKAKEGLALDVKSTIWTAGFPRRNKSIISPTGLLKELCTGNYADVFQRAQERAYRAHSRSTPEERQEQRIEFDFIGPGIDIGFRLCSFATIQKMVISMDVAFILAVQRGDRARVNEAIYYDGRVPLKGVFDGKPYPLFWIDNSPKSSFWARESEARHPIDDKHVIDFCKDFYSKREHYKDFAHAPFIFEDPGGSLAKLPAGYLKWLTTQRDVYQEWQELQQKQVEEERAIGRTVPERSETDSQIDLADLPRRLLDGIASQATPPSQGRKRAGAGPSRPDRKKSPKGS